MLRVEPQHIAKYSKCPRRAQRAWDQERPSNLNFEGTVIQQVIQAAYLHLSRMHKVPPWRRIIGWADLHYKRLFVNSPDSRSREYKSAVSLLNSLYGWYHKLFLPKIHNTEALINVPIRLDLGHDVVYQDSIPVVIIQDNVTLADFRQLDKSENIGMMRVYNDLLIHVRIWGFYQAAQQLPSHYIRFFIMPESIKAVEIKVTKEMLANAAVISKHILTGIKDGVFYPSFSEQCARCPFRRDCLV